MSTPLLPATTAGLWFPSDPQLSPDGTRVAWSSGPIGRPGEYDEQSIWLAPVDGSRPGRRWTFGGEDHTPRWSPDGSVLAFLSDRAERGTHGIYLLAADGGEARPLLVRKRSVASFAWSPDGSRLAFLAPDEPTDDDERREKERDDADVFGERWQSHHVWLVDADASADAAEPRLAWSSSLHALELAWSPAGDGVAVLAAESPLLEHRMASVLHLVTVRDSADTGKAIADAPFGGSLGWADATTIVWSGPHERAPQSSQTVWRVSTGGGVPEVIGTSADEPRCTIGLAHGPRGVRPIGVVAEGLDTRLEWIDCLGDDGREVAADVGGEVESVTIADAAAGPVLAFVHYGPGLVPRVMAGPPGQLRSIEPSGEHEDGLRAIALGQVEPLRCSASDGTAIDAVVIRPVDAGDGPWPTVVLPHGGPYGRSAVWAHAHPLDWGQLLATHGYAVLMPNYRGGYGHGNAFATAARADMGGAEWGDVLALVDATVEAGIADPDRLGIGGWSQGGFLTAWAVTATDRFKAAVMGAGVSDWGMLASTGDLPYFEAALGGSLPWDGPGPHHADERSPISYASRRTTPLLILHGAEDARVPVTQAISFHRALIGQPAPLELVVYPREPHGIRERQHQIDLQQRVLDWFDRYLRD